MITLLTINAIIVVAIWLCLGILGWGNKESNWTILTTILSIEFSIVLWSCFVIWHFISKFW